MHSDPGAADMVQLIVSLSANGLWFFKQAGAGKAGTLKSEMTPIATNGLTSFQNISRASLFRPEP
jgi:hypothetical protein